MSVSNRCWNVLLNESAQNGVFIDANSSPIVYSTLNLDSIEERIQYLFKYSPYHIVLSKNSIIDFANKVPGAFEVLKTVSSTKNLTICSLSSGLGEDLIGFLCALKELKLMPTESTSVGLINKYESCCNTAKNLFDANNVYHFCKSLEYIQCDPLTDWTAEAENFLVQSDAIFLSLPFIKCINKSSIFLKFIKGLFKILKSGAVVFCFFKEKQDEYFRSKNFNGLILNDPLDSQVSNLPFDNMIIEIIGKKPILSGSCSLTVWKKKDNKLSPSPSFQNESSINQDQSTVLSACESSSKVTASEPSQNVQDSDSLKNITKSERILISLVESLEYLEAVMKDQSSPNSSSSPLEIQCPKSEKMKTDSLVIALSSLEESLERLCCAVKVSPITCSATTKSQPIEADTEFNAIKNGDECESNEYSNNSLGLLIQSLNNLIDKLEH